MDWVKKHYDLAILALATLALATNAAWIATRPDIKIEGIPPKPSPSNKFDEPNLQAVQDASAAASAPARWQPDTTGAKGSLFVSRKYLLKDGKLLDPIEGGEMLHPPIPNAWFDENRLDLSNSRIKEIDSDEDGFSNLEEFEAKTKPNDKSSTPPPFTKLQFVAYKPMPFGVIFKSVNDMEKGKTFFLNSGGKSYGYRIGSEFEVNGTTYKIRGYQQKPSDIIFSPLLKDVDYKLNATGVEQYFRINIPENKSRLSINTAKFEDDCGVYVKNDEPPSDQNDLSKFTISGTDPNVAVDISKSGNYFLMLDNLKGYYKISFSAENCVVTVKYVKNSPAGELDEDEKEMLAKWASFEHLGVEKFPDISELKIENINTRETTVLVKNQQINDPTSVGEFRNLLNNQLMSLKKGQEFTISPDTTKFKVIDIFPDAAQIEDVASGKKHRISKSSIPSP